MATTITIADLPSSRALDYRALSAIRGAGAGDWVLFAFQPYRPPVAPLVPVVNLSFFADQLNLQLQNIDVKDSGSGAITIDAPQNASNNISVVPISPHQ